MLILAFICGVISLVCGLAFSFATGNFHYLVATFVVDYFAFFLTYVAAEAVYHVETKEEAGLDIVHG